MATLKRVLYHWTHESNLPSILSRGLDPEEATGELYAVWGCELPRLQWAQDHVASRHKWLPRDLVLLRVDVSTCRVYKTCWSGVFYTPVPIPPDQITVRSYSGRFVPLEAVVDPRTADKAG